MPEKSFWNSSHFAPLDGLRAVSVLIVIAYHTDAALTSARIPLIYYVKGELGVDIFFVLSGFLITTLLLREERGGRKIALFSFYIRRMFRILPMYLFTIVIYMVVGLMPAYRSKLYETLAGLPYFLTLRNEYVPTSVSASLGHTWSLSVEEKFYLVWPLLFFVLLPGIGMRWTAFLLPIFLYFLVSKYLLFTAYAATLVGCLAAIWLEANRSNESMTVARFEKIPSLIMFALCIGGYLVSWRYYWPLKIVLSVCIAMLIPFLLLRRSFLQRFLGWWPMVWIGKRTYSMYLLHGMIGNVVEHKLLLVTSDTTYVAAVVLSFGLTLGAAQITYNLIEAPMIELGRRIAGGLWLTGPETKVASPFRRGD